MIFFTDILTLENDYFKYFRLQKKIIRCNCNVDVKIVKKKLKNMDRLISHSIYCYHFR